MSIAAHLKEGWEQGIIQIVVLVLSSIGAWMMEWPQKWWARLKNWRASRGNALKAIAADIAKISYQINPNGGGSLRDVVDRTESTLESLKRDTSLNTALLKFQSDISDESTFYMTPDGQVTTASAAMQKMLGVSERDLAGFGWKGYIAQDEAPGYIADQELCIRERRRFQKRVHWVDSDGARIMTDVTVTQYPDDRSQELQSLMAHIRPVPA